MFAEEERGVCILPVREIEFREIERRDHVRRILREHALIRLRRLGIAFFLHVGTGELEIHIRVERIDRGHLFVLQRGHCRDVLLHVRVTKPFQRAQVFRIAVLGPSENDHGLAQ